MYTVYALKSKKKNYIYVGMTNNLVRRFGEHNKLKVKSTKAFAPYELLFTEIVLNRVDARVREKYYKTGKGKDFLKALTNRPEW